jgi:membrane protease YdiL (CAAX protease family)
MNGRLASLIGIGLLGALVAAALEPGLRLPLTLALAAASWLLPSGPVRWAAAAAVPVALILAWGGLAGGSLPLDGLDCADPLSPLAWLRVAEAATVITLVLLLARRLGSTLRALGLARPSRPELLAGITAIFIIPIPSLYFGAALAEPFFGPIRLDLSQPLAFVPALTLAVANGTMEEVAYRGALMSWMSRATGPTVALIGQAIVFGAAHTGTDFVTSPLPVVLTVIAGGLIAGLIVRRTGSLWLPIVVHIALDVPLYYAAACRLP